MEELTTLLLFRHLVVNTDMDIAGRPETTYGSDIEVAAAVPENPLYAFARLRGHELGNILLERQRIPEAFYASLHELRIVQSVQFYCNVANKILLDSGCYRPEDQEADEHSYTASGVAVYDDERISDVLPYNVPEGTPRTADFSMQHAEDRLTSAEADRIESFIGGVILDKAQRYDGKTLAVVCNGNWGKAAAWALAGGDVRTVTRGTLKRAFDFERGDAITVHFYPDGSRAIREVQYFPLGYPYIRNRTPACVDADTIDQFDLPNTQLCSRLRTCELDTATTMEIVVSGCLAGRYNLVG